MTDYSEYLAANWSAINTNFRNPAIDLVVDDGKLDEFVLAQPKVVNRVVSQSIAPGTIVTEGTAVDLTFAPPRTVPGDIFIGGHQDLKTRLLSDVYDSLIVESDDLKSLLEARDDVADLSADDVAFLTTFAEEQDLIVTAEPGQTANDLFVSLQIANTFNG